MAGTDINNRDGYNKPELANTVKPVHPLDFVNASKDRRHPQSLANMGDHELPG